MSTPLEEERRALLARMQASREVCRSRFPPQTPPEQFHDPAASPLHSEQPFPRSHTFRFMQRIIHRIGGRQP